MGLFKIQLFWSPQIHIENIGKPYRLHPLCQSEDSASLKSIHKHYSCTLGKYRHLKSFFSPVRKFFFQAIRLFEEDLSAASKQEFYQGVITCL